MIDTLTLFILTALIFLCWAVYETKEYKTSVYNKLRYGMSVKTMVNGECVIGYVVAFNTKQVTLVLFDFPHDLVERKITELIF